MKYLSRKFIITILILLFSSAIPVVYKGAGVSDMVVMAVLTILGAIGSAYHVANVKDAAIPTKGDASESPPK